ncbi:PAS domain-containing sensor histidine kinase [Candidatus Saccharibacteria bacterium]|nr:PAS domain-containing sensor histidine kinase [Candidatus Saccharibacteria bacterium]
MTGSVHKSPKSSVEKKLTDQRKSIEALKRLLTYYQEITDTIREPFIILDKDLCVVTANLAFYHAFKVLKTQTEGKLIYKLGNNQWEIPKLRELLENILPKDKIMNGFEVTHDFPDIGPKTMLLNARQLDHKQLILLAIEDVTKRKKLQSDTEQMTANLVKQHNKLKALSDTQDEFIMLASHQLRTPATIVKQYTSMLREGYAGALSKKQLKILDSAIVSNQWQLEIIEDLLRVAKVDDGKVYLEKLKHDVVRLIDEVIEGQHITFDARNQRIVFNKPTIKVSAIMDAKLMRMVLENLLDNASKYSPKSKTITVGLKQTKKETTISINDKGVGILKKDQHKLFEKFSRIDNSLSMATAGTGLGLYWVKKIVELHDGTIEVISKKDYGSLFTIKIPTFTDDIHPREILII